MLNGLTTRAARTSLSHPTGISVGIIISILVIVTGPA